MSPTYTAPAIETIHQGEQLFTSDSHREPLLSGPSFDGSRERPRPSSSRSDTHGRKQHRSGSPQVHPYLKASPVTEDARRASSIPVPKPSLRRHASADFSLLKGQGPGLVGGLYRLGGEDAEGVKDMREQKRVRLSPSPRRPTPLRSLSFHHAPDVQSERASGSPSVGKDTSTTSEPAIHGMSMGTPADALRYLEGDSRRRSVDHVPVNEERHPWPEHDGKVLSPTQRSSSSASSSSSGSPHSVAASYATVDTELSAASHALDGEETPVVVAVPVPGSGPARSSPPGSNSRRRSGDPDRYGTPEMPRGSAKLPHLPANDLTTPRVPAQSHPKYLPRAEKLPMSGYELLASTISSSSSTVPASSRARMSAFLDNSSTTSLPAAARGKVSRRHSSASFASQTTAATMVMAPADEELTIKPIYRRFEALNHRLLLHLQDELSELEEQLHRLDTTDTQTRRLQSSILPASRRAEFLAGGELQWHKTDILSKIAFKLGQYNHTLSSFTSTRDLPAPALSAVTEYRDYLATHRPISDVETRFLDSTDDLITLEAPVDNNSARDSGSATSSTRADVDARPPASDYLQSLRLLPDEPTVTPIPGTMHGNSWLVRHNRLSSSSLPAGGSGSRGSSATSSSPRSARHRPSSLEPLASPRLPPSPLRQHRRAASDDAVPSEAEDNKNSNSNSKTGPLERGAQPAHLVAHLAMAVAVAVLLPVLTFSIVPGFVARMIVVLLVGLSVVGSVAQAVDVKRAAESRGDLVYSGAVYAGVMAIVAGVMA